MYNKAISISKEKLGEKNMHTANIYNSMGFVFFQQGNYQKALECDYLSLNISKEVFGENHPNTKSIIKNIENVKAKLNLQ